MAHIFFEKLENRRSTQSLVTEVPERIAQFYYGVVYPSDGYPRSFYPDNAPDTSSVSRLNQSMPWNQSQMWNLGWPSLQTWNLGWDQSQMLNLGFPSSQSWNLGWDQSQMLNLGFPSSQSWNLGWNQSQMLNLGFPSSQSWNLGWNQSQMLNLGFPSSQSWQPLNPSHWYMPWDNTSPGVIAYGVGIPTGTSSGILF